MQDFFQKTPADDTCTAALAALDANFEIQQNVPFKRSIFHKGKQ